MTTILVMPASDTNCVRVFVDGQQWCKVYGYSAAEAAERGNHIRDALQVHFKDPNQGELPLQPLKVTPAVAPRFGGCPTPTRYGQDQYRCRECYVIWDVNEPRPDCNIKSIRGT